MIGKSVSIVSIKNLFLSTSLMAVSTVNATAWVGLKVGELGPDRSTEATKMFASEPAKSYQAALKAVKKSYTEWLKGVMPQKKAASDGELLNLPPMSRPKDEQC